MNTFKIAIVLFTCSYSLYAQQPLDKIRLVADKIVRDTQFNFQLELSTPNEYFDFIEVVDFKQNYGSKSGVAFAFTEIISPIDQSIEVQVSHNDGLLITLNKEAVYRNVGVQEPKVIRGERGIVLDSSFSMVLQKGKNELLLKSSSDGKGDWTVYLQPKGALVFDERGIKRNPLIGLTRNDLITKEVANLSNWLILGPFDGELTDSFGVEEGLVVGKTYETNNGLTSWTLPKINVFGNVTNRHPLWGGYTNFNYHTGGVAWAMMHLATVTGKEAYDSYAKDYTDFHIRSKPFVGYQVYQLNGFKSANHHLFETPLLDFTLAPAMPYVYRLITDPNFDNREAYEKWVAEVTEYALNQQIRSPKGHFWRYTPRKFTSWTDDMFMGLPYLMHLSELTDDPELRQQLYDDASSQLFAFNEQTFNEKDHLYQHAQYSEDPVKMPYWTRANGWGIWATTEVLLRLPKDHKNYRKIVKHFQQHAEAIISYQNERGFWYNVIDQPQTGDETSGTAILTLAIARGVNQGWLDKRFGENAIKGWNALETVIDDDGTVHGICMGTMCSTDLDYYKNRPILDNDSHGILGLIFAAIEVDSLLNPIK